MYNKNLAFLVSDLIDHQYVSENLKTTVLARLRDKENYTLKMRWWLYVKASKLGILELDDYVNTPECLDTRHFNWYDTFNIERYQTVYFWQIVESIKESGPDSMFFPLLDQLKEDIMALEVVGFVYDW